MSAAPNDITEVLAQLREGDEAAVDALMPRVYDTLHALARRHMQRERPGHTLSPTGLVNEAYLKLVDQQNTDWQNRAHFFSIAARIMRRILINHAAKRSAAKRGSGEAMVTFDEAGMLGQVRDDQLLFLDDALNRLSQLNERQARVVELRFFGGLTHEEVGVVLNISPASARRDWRLARAWLHRELSHR